MVKIVVQLALIVVQYNSTDIGKDRCTVASESASDRRRRLAREKLQKCHLADIKLFFPLAFSQSRSPAYVCTALLVHVTMQILLFFLLLFLLYIVTGFFPANHKSVSVLFLFTCILYCIAFLLLREAFLRMRIPSKEILLLPQSHLHLAVGCGDPGGICHLPGRKGLIQSTQMHRCRSLPEALLADGKEHGALTSADNIARTWGHWDLEEQKDMQ